MLTNLRHTNRRAYSGPLSLRVDCYPSIDVDIFGLSEFMLRHSGKSKLLSVPQQGNAQSFDVSVNCENQGYQELVADAPAGMYRAIYTGGSFNCFNGEPGFFNYGINTQFSGQDFNDLPSYRLWLRLNEDPNQLYYFDDPVFRTAGYATASDAENASLGEGFTFYHPGGKIEGIADDEIEFFADNIGTIQLHIDNAVCQGYNQSTPGPRTGFWDVIWSSLPNKADWPVMDAPTAAYPTIGNIKPGVHILRYQLDLVDPGCPWYQDIYIRAWNMPPRQSPMAFIDEFNKDIPQPYQYVMTGPALPAQPSLFPVKPTKLIQASKFQNPAPRGGSKTHQLPKYSGNDPERPESPNNYDKPKTLNPNESF